MEQNEQIKGSYVQSFGLAASRGQTTMEPLCVVQGLQQAGTGKKCLCLYSLSLSHTTWVSDETKWQSCLLYPLPHLELKQLSLLSSLSSLANLLLPAPGLDSVILPEPDLCSAL